MSFDVPSIHKRVQLFTTRVDTVFGVSYIVLAPEHPYVAELIKDKENEAELQAFITRMKNMSDIERTANDAKKEGMFTGAYAVNPLNGAQVPIWIANYVLADYGTGAVMGVPAHDQRDWDFAHEFNLPVHLVIQNKTHTLSVETMTEAYHESGTLVNSGDFDGLTDAEARKAVTQWLQEKKNWEKAP